MKPTTKNQKVLTKEEEFEAFNKYRLLDIALQSTTDFNKQQQILTTKAKLKNYIFKKNEGLLFLISKRQFVKHKTNVEFDDIFQFASISLLKAIDGYDVMSGYRFSSYAMRVMELDIIKNVREMDRVVRIPDKVFGEYSVINKKLAMKNPDGVNKDINEVAEELGKSSEYVSTVVNILQSAESPECLEDKENNYLKEFEHGFLTNDIKKCIDTLSFENRFVVVNYFGLENNARMTFDEISSVMGITKSAVGQRMDTILKNLRESKLINVWRNYETN